MHSDKRIVKLLAKNHRLDPDEIIIALWDHADEKGRFDYLENENSIVRNKDFRLAKEIINSIKNGKRKPQKTIKLIYKDHNFESVGRIANVVSHITKEEVLKIYDELVKDFGSSEDPISPSGLKDEKLLESALFHMETGYRGKTKYPTAESAGAALMYSLSHNHAFHNGNKRTAMVAALVFLDKHNISLTCTEDDLFKI